MSTYSKWSSYLQTIFAVAFLLLFFAMAFILIKVYVSGLPMTAAANTMLSTLLGYTSAKLNTIVDYLFGGSLGTPKEIKKEEANDTNLN